MQGSLGTSHKRRGKSNKSTNATLEVQTYSAGGSFLKLEQVLGHCIILRLKFFI